MKFRLPILIAVVTVIFSLQANSQQLITNPVASLKLVIEQEGGTNGTAVVFNPEKQLYYTVFAGNSEYPLETFTREGKNIYQSNAGNDMRGMWWNAKAHALEGNCYADGGIVAIGLTGEGYAGEFNTQIFGGNSHQPDDQSVGVFDPVKKEILYYGAGLVSGYSRKTGKPTKTFVILDIPVDNEDINWSTMISTGVKKMELGVMDYNTGKVYLFDKATGDHTATVQLPSNAVIYDKFNFSYANGYIFLFDQDERAWTGYRIF